jgi:hypothetical protein
VYSVYGGFDVRTAILVSGFYGQSGLHVECEVLAPDLRRFHTRRGRATGERQVHGCFRRERFGHHWGSRSAIGHPSDMKHPLDAVNDVIMFGHVATSGGRPPR